MQLFFATALAASILVAQAPQPSAPPAAVPEASSPAGPFLPKIGHVRATSAFCAVMANDLRPASVQLSANNRTLGAISETIDRIMANFRALDGDLRMTTDRVTLMKQVDSIVQSIPQLDRQIAAVRSASGETTNPKIAENVTALAGHMQNVAGAQGQMGYDLQGVVRSLIQIGLRPNYIDSFSQTFQDATIGAPAAALSLKSYLKWNSRIRAINEAQAAAAAEAPKVLKHC